MDDRTLSEDLRKDKKLVKDVNSINKWGSETCKYQSKTNKIEMVSKHFFRKILRFMILKISVFET